MVLLVSFVVVVEVIASIKVEFSNDGVEEEDDKKDEV